MATKQTVVKTEPMPMLKTVEQMSKVSGLGENKLRDLMDKGEIEYVQNGNRRLLSDRAIWNWYMCNRILPHSHPVKKESNYVCNI